MWMFWLVVDEWPGSDEQVLEYSIVSVCSRTQHRTDSMGGRAGGPGIDSAISNSTRLSAFAWAKWELFQETLEQ